MRRQKTHQFSTYSPDTSTGKYLPHTGTKDPSFATTSLVTCWKRPFRSIDWCPSGIVTISSPTSSLLCISSSLSLTACDASDRSSPNLAFIGKPLNPLLSSPRFSPARSPTDIEGSATLLFSGLRSDPEAASPPLPGKLINTAAKTASSSNVSNRILPRMIYTKWPD